MPSPLNTSLWCQRHFPSEKRDYFIGYSIRQHQAIAYLTRMILHLDATAFIFYASGHFIYQGKKLFKGSNELKHSSFEIIIEKEVQHNICTQAKAN